MDKDSTPVSEAMPAHFDRAHAAIGQLEEPEVIEGVAPSFSERLCMPYKKSDGDGAFEDWMP